MAIYYIYYVFIFLSSLITANDKRLIKYVTGIVFVFLFLLSALRGIGVDRDYTTYLYNINVILNKLEYLDLENLIYYEPSYFIIPFICIKIFNSVQLFFITYAFMGVAIKLRAMYLTNSFFLSILLYFSSWFLLHEMTQVRAGVAIGILCLSIKNIYNREFSKFFLKLLLACFFHYSSILFLPAYLLNPFRIRKYLLLLFVIVAFILAYTGFNIVDNQFITIFEGTKVDVYNKIAKTDAKALTMLNGGFVLNLLLSAFILFFVDKITPYNKYGILMVKINTVSLFIYLILSSIPTIAVRTSELYSIVQMFLFPSIIYIFPRKSFGYVFIILLSFVYWYIYFFASKTIGNYNLFF